MLLPLSYRLHAPSRGFVHRDGSIEDLTLAISVDSRSTEIGAQFDTHVWRCRGGHAVTRRRLCRDCEGIQTTIMAKSRRLTGPGSSQRRRRETVPNSAHILPYSVSEDLTLILRFPYGNPTERAASLRLLWLRHRHRLHHPLRRFRLVLPHYPRGPRVPTGAVGRAERGVRRVPVM